MSNSSGGSSNSNSSPPTNSPPQTHNLYHNNSMNSSLTAEQCEIEERTAARVGCAANILSGPGISSSAPQSPSGVHRSALPPRAPSHLTSATSNNSPRASMPPSFNPAGSFSRRSSMSFEEDSAFDYPLAPEELAELRKKRTARNPSYAHIFPQDQWPGFRPIEEHGLIGNMHTCALVSTDAEISWYCYPHFDSPSIFAAILDSEKGGHFVIRAAVEQGGPAPNVTHRQLYHSETNVLISRFLTDSGVGQVIDYMPVGRNCRAGHGWLIRELECVRGKMYFEVECEPAFNYARDPHEVQIVTHGARFKTDKLSMVLTSSKKRTWTVTPRNGVQTKLKLVEGQRAVFIFRESKSPSAYPNEDPTKHDNTGHPATEELTEHLKVETIEFWRNWISKCTYTGRWREAVYRSALVLKLLTFEPTGAIVAAPTTSLPESIGGPRNWDYRFAWIRDSSFVLYAFIKLGFREEAAAFMNWISKRCFAAGTQVLMYDGSVKKVEDLKLKDVLMGDDQTPRPVIHLHEGHTGEAFAAGKLDAAMYQIGPDKSGFQSFACNEEHSLMLQFHVKPYVEILNGVFWVKWIAKKDDVLELLSNNPHLLHEINTPNLEIDLCYKRCHTAEEADAFMRALNWKPFTVEMPVKNFVRLSSEIQQIALLYQLGGPVHFAPLSDQDTLAARVQSIFGHCSERLVHKTAWLLGLWLARGVDGQASVRLEEKQDIIVNELVEWYQMANQIRIEEDDIAQLVKVGNDNDECVKKVSLGAGFNCLLRGYALYISEQTASRFVPPLLQREDIQIRSAVLTGLIDGSDMYRSKEHDYYFVSANETLANDVKQLAAGLNFHAEPLAKHSLRGGEHVIAIQGNQRGQLQSIVHQSRAPSKVADPDFHLTHFTVHRLAHSKYYGFEVSGTNHRFLLADTSVAHNCEESSRGDGSLQIMYGLHGEHKLEELELDHLSGYMDSKPVRIGNGAYDQVQLDIYGELLDTVYLSNKYAEPISYEFWLHVRKMVDWICEHWQESDEGIWEVRGGQQHFVYSKVMSWVALDRGIRLAERRSFPADLPRWYKIRNQIYEEIQEKGFSKKRNAFVQHYGSETLDASVLIMPLVFFMSPTDPRFVSTLDAILASTADDGLVSNNLVFRYNVEHTKDGLVGEEGTFSICTFWAVEAAARLGMYKKKYLEKARLMFEQMLGYANHAGLYSEEIGKRGEHLGNYPQAFTHLSLISAAINLDKALNFHRGGGNFLASSRDSSSSSSSSSADNPYKLYQQPSNPAPVGSSSAGPKVPISSTHQATVINPSPHEEVGSN